jgi:DNA-binding MarR family transcriptional regulator
MQDWGIAGMHDKGPIYGEAGGAAGLRHSGAMLVIGTGDAVPLPLARTADALGLRCALGSDAGDIPAHGGAFTAIWATLDTGDCAALLDALDAALTGGGTALLLDISGAAIDPVWSRFGDRDGVILLNTPDPNEIHAAVAAMTAGQSMALHSPVETRHNQQLERLQEEVNRIARTLAKMSEPEARMLIRSPDGSREPPSPFIENHLREARQSFAGGGSVRALGEEALPTAPPVTAREVRRLIRLRRARDQFFDPELFADPGWDMLLDLYAARLEHNRVAVSSLCIAAAVPATTALRWIKALTTAGLFERRADPHDGRRIFVALSDSATAAMHAYFAAIVEEGAVI